MNKSTQKRPLTEEQLRESDRLKALFEGTKKALRLTQKKIAAELDSGVTQRTVSHLLNRRMALDLGAAVVFSRLLKVPVSEFSERLASDLNNLPDEKSSYQTATLELSPHLSGTAKVLTMQKKKTPAETQKTTAADIERSIQAMNKMAEQLWGNGREAEAKALIDALDALNRALDRIRIGETRRAATLH